MPRVYLFKMYCIYFNNTSLPYGTILVTRRQKVFSFTKACLSSAQHLRPLGFYVIKLRITSMETAVLRYVSDMNYSFGHELLINEIANFVYSQNRRLTIAIFLRFFFTLIYPKKRIEVRQPTTKTPETYSMTNTLSYFFST